MKMLQDPVWEGRSEPVGAIREARMTPKARSGFVDVLKGYAALLVVFGHAFAVAYPGSFRNNIIFITIYSFHMPLFMFISGYLSYGKMGGPLVPAILRRVLKIIPVYILWHVLYALFDHDRNLWQAPWQFWKQAFLFPDAPWYLPIFLYCYCILALVQIAGRKAGPWIYALFFAAILFMPFPATFGLIKVKWYSFYLVLGFLVRGALLHRERTKAEEGLTGHGQAPLLSGTTVAAFLLFPAIILLGALWVREPGNIDFRLFESIWRKPSLWVLYYAGAIAGIFFSFHAAKLLERTFLRSGLQWLGRYSLEIYLAQGLYMTLGLGTGWVRLVTVTLVSLGLSCFLVLIAKGIPILDSILFGFDIRIKPPITKPADTGLETSRSPRGG
jgi:fucose 4-O-acetylase-like acetyltransferase